MSDLDNFIGDYDKNSKFIKLEEGEPVVGIFQEAKLVDDNFNKGEKTMEYTLEIDGKDKSFSSKSVKLARLIKPFKKGDKLEIVKQGTGFSTIWYVSKR